MSVRKIARLAVLTALALALGWAESFIPMPVPGMKLGLSNTVLLYALYLIDIPSAVTLMLLKVLLSGFTYAGISAMLYSLGGGVVSLTAMALIRGRGEREASVIAVSVAGGLFHNVGQCVVAGFVIGWLPVGTLLPVLMLAGAAMGFLTGLAAKYAIAALKKIGGGR